MGDRGSIRRFANIGPNHGCMLRARYGLELHLFECGIYPAYPPERGRVAGKEHMGAVSGSAMDRTIADQGSGIPAEKIAKLGEPFYTTKDKATGLGLMIAYKIVEAHRGKIGIKSKIGKGTIVKVKLPIIAR